MEGDNIGKGAVSFYVVVLFLMSSSVLVQFLVEKNSISVLAMNHRKGRGTVLLGILEFHIMEGL